MLVAYWFLTRGTNHLWGKVFKISFFRMNFDEIWLNVFPPWYCVDICQNLIDLVSFSNLYIYKCENLHFKQVGYF